jgi:hypothetical protein
LCEGALIFALLLFNPFELVSIRLCLEGGGGGNLTYTGPAITVSIAAAVAAAARRPKDLAMSLITLSSNFSLAKCPVRK